MSANQIGLFIGGNPNPEGLWVVKNGTLSELTGITGAVGGTGLFDNLIGDGPDFTQFNASQINGLALFQGEGADNRESLWVTDGTAAGTRELLNNTMNNGGLLSMATSGQPGFAVLNSNQVLFAGVNAAGAQGVWSTDGTAAGTFQVSGGNMSIQPQWFVNFGSSVMFSALGAAGKSTLFISDGTSAGTHEITGIKGFDPVGGLIPQHLHRLGGLVLFEGTDIALNEGLWVSDGTGTGTHELTGIANANSMGLFLNVGVTIDFINYNGKALFPGEDTGNNVGLWMTDGTSAGTTEIAPASITGAASQFDPNNFILYDGKVFFSAESTTDMGGGGSLWETDGTAAGTTRITAPNEQVGGFFSNGGKRSQPSFIIVNGQLLFRGEDNTGHFATWAFNGSGSPVEISSGPATINEDGNTPFGTGLLSPSSPLLQAGGTVVSWVLQNGQFASGNVLTTAASGWSVVGTGDFTGNGQSDVALQNGGTVVDWLLQNGQFQSGNVLTTAASGWSVVGAGDFTGNGVSDLVLQDGHGTVVDWLMKNGQFSSGNVLTTGAVGWSVVGTGDFTGNGVSDVVLQSGGTVVDWIMKNGQFQSGNVLATGATGWSVVGTGDFTGNGSTDVLLQNGGTVVDWIIQNGQFVSGNVLTTAAAGWTVVGTGDYNADGTSDVMLQNGGTVVNWIIKNGQFSSGNVVSNAATGWHVAGTV